MVESKAKFIDKDLLPLLVEVPFTLTICLGVVSENVGSLLALSCYKPLSTVCAYATASKPSVDPADVDDLAVNLSYCDCNH